MFRNLLVCMVGILSGCILYVEPYGSDSSGGSYDFDFWFDNVSVGCDYDYYYDESYWYVTADTGGPGVYDILGVEALVDDLYAAGFTEAIYMYATSDTHWEGEFISSYYYCGYSYDFEFVAYDYDGNWVNAWTVW